MNFNFTLIPTSRYFKIAAITFGVFLMVIIIFTGSALVYAKVYEGNVFPGVYIGNYHLGGLSGTEVKDVVERFNDRLAQEGVDYYFTNDDGKNIEEKVKTISADGSSVDLLSLDSKITSEKAMGAGREGSWLNRVADLLRFRFFSRRLSATAVIENGFEENIKKSLSEFEDKPNNANVQIVGFEPLLYNIIPEKSGAIFDYEDIIRRTVENVSQFDISPIKIAKVEFIPEVKTSDLNAVLPQLSNLLSNEGIDFAYYASSTQQARTWHVSSTIFADWIETQKMDDGKVVFAFNKDKVVSYLDTIRSDINVPIQEARFVVENGKVKEVENSGAGVEVDVDSTYANINLTAAPMNYGPVSTIVNIVVNVVEPQVKVADLNDLGITEIIGVGTSTFRDSHTNRIKNIARAVERLNGLLIKPGEQFSAVLSTGPFNAASGYLPEAVIKGKEIKNEIGGGMCQIGTTLFRMAMNSGMPISERRNHSLVVSYYADPVNGNPGTDATVYEPNVDFKFLNDTGNYLLLQTKIDYKKQLLTFTLWGKNDGRKGWYTHPKVSRWIPAGEPEEVQVTTLKPGEKKCQNAFRGAVASFIYTRTLPSGENVERVFDSYYRPLPQICMVGAELPPPDGSATTSTEQMMGQ